MKVTGKLEKIEDQSGWQEFGYGSMGEVNGTRRAYILPFANQKDSMLRTIRIQTFFEYDSWGRIKNITYPDDEDALNAVKTK